MGYENERDGAPLVEDRRSSTGFRERRAVRTAVPASGCLGCCGLLLLCVMAFFGVTNADIDTGGLPRVPGAQSQSPTGSRQIPNAPAKDSETVQFVRFVVSNVNDYWTKSFAKTGQRYRPARLVLFEDATRSACGGADAAAGPHYCPEDENVYLDLAFFRELDRRFGAPGDFAQAYVIAHEYGHHVQNVTGLLASVSATQQRNPWRANELNIRLELQADCLAGVWAYSTYEQGLLEKGDLEEGLRAAAAVGDDRIQRQSSGRVNKESWTHGSSEQRMRWFGNGFRSGSAAACDTFKNPV